MKWKVNQNYINNIYGYRNPVQQLDESKHHLLPLKFFPDEDEDNVMMLPHEIHKSLHRQFPNHVLIQDPIGCIIKVVRGRLPVKNVCLGDFLVKKDKPKFRADDLNPYIKTKYPKNLLAIKMSRTVYF